MGPSISTEFNTALDAQPSENQVLEVLCKLAG